MKKIAVVTGTRAEYGILKPVMAAIQKEEELTLSLIVSGMHLSREFGYTADIIENDGFRIDGWVSMIPENDTLSAMAVSVGQGITETVKVLDQQKPDIVLVLGDRTEPLAAAIASAYMNIPVGHIHGGDACTGGNIDDSNRFAITKFAHLHFPATEKSAERILKLGEEEWRVHTVGSPALDAILNEQLPEPHELAGKLGLDLSKKIVVVIQHPVTIQMKEAASQMKETLDAVVESGHQSIVIYPNSDAGGRKMIEVIKSYESNPLVTAVQNLPRPDYLGLLSIADVLVGNSSSGIIDAPSFGLPAVNIGIRQEGRERGINVIDARHKKLEIMKDIQTALFDDELRAKIKQGKNPYGDGNASQRIAEILKETVVTPELLRKRITY